MSASIFFQSCYAIITDMEPRQTGPGGAIESVPSPAPIFEMPSGGNRTVEYNGERSGESRPEVGAVYTEASQIAMPTALPVPVLTSNGAAATSSSLTDASVPIAANDDDLIEKEWVDKAKKILAETRDDPHRREVEVSKLQIEYIRKRYGREIGAVSDGQ